MGLSELRGRTSGRRGGVRRSLATPLRTTPRYRSEKTGSSSVLYCDLRRPGRFRTALEDLNCANTVAGYPDAGSIDVPNPERSVAKADDLLQWIGKRSTMYPTSSGGYSSGSRAGGNRGHGGRRVRLAGEGRLLTRKRRRRSRRLARFRGERGYERPKPFYRAWNYGQLPDSELIRLTPEEVDEQRRLQLHIVRTAVREGVSIA